MNHWTARAAESVSLIACSDINVQARADPRSAFALVEDDLADAEIEACTSERLGVNIKYDSTGATDRAARCWPRSGCGRKEQTPWAKQRR